MGKTPNPAEIFERAIEEGQRRLDQTMLELTSNSFIAGFTIVFGVVALGIVHAMLQPYPGRLASLGGALAFGVGLVFLIVGRTELFTENFFDPVATATRRWDAHLGWRLGRLWVVSLVVNLLGVALLVLILSVDGALPHGTAESLSKMAEEIAGTGAWATLVSAIVGGGLVTLLSFLIEAANHVLERITLAYIVGVLLALGPFDHVVVTGVHLLFGVLFGAKIGAGSFAATMGIALAGNLVGGLGLVATTHIAQAVGAEEAGES